MSLLNRYEEIKKEEEKLNDIESKLTLKREIAKLVQSILIGDERYSSNEIGVFKKFKVKYKKEEMTCWFGSISTTYSCKITKTLIKKVEEYLESENEYE